MYLKTENYISITMVHKTTILFHNEITELEKNKLHSTNEK